MTGHVGVGDSVAQGMRPPFVRVAAVVGAGSRAMAAPLRGAGFGALAVTLVAAGVAGQNLYLAGPVVDGLLGIGMVVLPMVAIHGALASIAWAARAAVRGVGRGPRFAAPHPVLASSIAITAILILAPNGGPLSPLGGLVPFEILIVSGAVLGAVAAAGLSLGRTRRDSDARRHAGTSLVVAAVSLSLLIGGWAVTPGMGDELAVEDPSALAAIAQIDLPDPSQPGPFAVARATYGSGNAARRAEFGIGADWTTPTVDASGAIVRPDGVPSLYADFVHGFGNDALPLNGLVWYPTDPEARLPVALIVHGNHAAGDSSDPGYAYLGEHLASRGMIAVSVDENFLNGDAFFDYAGSEMGVRAWMLLAHLQQLRGWDADPEHPLAGRIDLDRVAIIGHSRGGEAAALAAAVEAGDRDVAGMPPAPTGFGIRAVVAIAPSDGMAGGSPISLTDVDYLVLQGAHDADLPAFAGLRTYHRVSFTGTGDHLKVALYSQRANHGRFNSVWDIGDAGPLASWMLDRGSILSPDEQQQLAKATIGAFLARSLQGETEYDAFFREPRAGRAWLPDDVVQTHWESSERVEAAGLGTGAVEDLPIVASDFRSIRSTDPMLRDNVPQGDRALRLAWSGSATLEVQVDPDAAAAIDPEGWLTMSLGTVETGPIPQPEVELIARGGSATTAALAAVAPARPVMPVRLWKLEWLGDRYQPEERIDWPAERFMQTYALPLRSFLAAQPGFDFAQVETIVLRFAGSGDVFLDDLAFEPS